MTRDPDDETPPDDSEGARREGDRKLDEDAAWRAIIAHYGDSPTGDFPSAEHDSPTDPSGSVADPPVAPSAEDPDPPRADTRFPSLDRRWTDPQNTEATWDDEGHFVPPEPPPLPQMEPRRKLAWIGLCGSPALMLVAVVFQIAFPPWFSALLMVGFLGGFGYLVATMPRGRDDDGSGDNGAVV